MYATACNGCARRGLIALGAVVAIVVGAAGDAAGQSAPAATLRPADLPDERDTWPNAKSWRNSDPWLVAHHDELRSMHPRVLVLNFANDVGAEQVARHAAAFVAATAESTRYRGFADAAAPAFLQYEVVRYVDLRDTDGPTVGQRVNSTRFPRKQAREPGEPLLDYAALYTDAFARHYGFVDPRQPSRYLNLHELIENGFVHELWFYAIHGEDGWPGTETCAWSQAYDAQLRPRPGQHLPTGNGHDRTMPWSGRTFRIAFLNPHRGVGCALENYGHTLEHLATSGAIPYFQRYFGEFAELQLDERFDVPFAELYRTNASDKDAVQYPDAMTMSVKIKDEVYRIENYIAYGGNVHFPPGARHHYDLDSPVTVRSSIENYRRPAAGADHAARGRPWSAAAFARYRDVAPDCMGRWLVYWRQAMPGLENDAVDDGGRPMKNWHVFLYY